MEHPDIDAWLDAVKEKKSLDKLEIKAAKAWYQTLTPVQREVFDKLQESYTGLTYLRMHRRTEDDEEAR